MRIAVYDSLSPDAPIEAFPVTIEQGCARWPAVLMLALLTLLLVVISIPIWLILASVVGEPSARALMIERPGATVLVVTGVTGLLALLAWPATRLIRRLMSTRTVTLAADQVRVRERGMFGGDAWSLPLFAFEGLAHHVRASLSGTRHELILVHSDRRKSVLISIADRMLQSEVERTCRLLGVREIPARALYDARASRPRHDLVMADFARAAS